MTELHPFLPFLAGAVLAAFTRGWLRAALMLAVPVIGALNLMSIEHGIHWQMVFLGYEVIPFRVDRLSILFGYLFHLAAFLGIIFSLHVKDRMQHVAGLIYAGSAMGAVFAGDLLTLFVFWEGLALSSVFLIWARRTSRALHAGMRYVTIQVLSGVLLLCGALVLAHDTGSLAFGYIGLEGLAGWLVFIAFGIKCAFPLLHGWLVDAYPEATVTGTVFLSAFTTKTAVYCLARGYPGTELLVYIGAVMTCLPIFYAVIENDLRRVLSYSLMNQLGFMVTGVGIGTALALNGTAAHAFAHIIYKALLFMSMGAVLYRVGTIKGSELGGLYRSMPWTATLCIIGAASISAFPLFSGFVSKAMVLSAALHEGYNWVWLALLFASAGVFHHSGIKIPFFAFFSHDAGLRVREAPWNMLLAMFLAAALCIFIGSYPWALYSLLPFDVEYSPYDASHVLAQLQLLVFSGLAFAWLKLSGLYPPELRSVNLDAEWVYRRLIPRSVRRLVDAVAPVAATVSRAFSQPLSHATGWLFRHPSTMPSVIVQGWPTGSMVLWVAVLLAVYLVLYYV